MEDGLDLAVSGVEHPPSPLPVEADSSGAPHCDQVESGEMVDSLLPKVVGSAGPLCEQGVDGGHAVDASPQDSGVSFRSLEVDDSVVPRCEDGAVAGDSLLAEVEESRAALCQLVQCEPDQDSLLQSSLVALHDVDPMTTVLEDEAVDATNAGSIAEDKEKSAGLGPDATVKSALEEEATSMDVETAEANDARSAAGVDEEKIAKLEPDAAVTSNLSGSEDSAKKVGMKMDADESEANDASSAWEEDVKTADSELDAAVKAASSGSEDSAEKEGMEMNTEEAEKEGMKMDTEEAEANDASSAGEEDEKTADLEPDAVVAAASSGREDSTEKEGIMMDTEEAGANEASFTGKEDEKTSDLDPDAPVVSASSDSQYAAEDAMKMDTEEAEANDASSTGEEDEKTADLEPDATTTSVVSGGDDAVEEETMEMDIEAAETMQGPGRRGGRRKKGRPPRAQAAARPPTRRKEEEEVCFICFDGGDLVVCDRRGCPKVYHPSCVNRDEAFFRAKGRWNCGWHICSICEKSAHYMCFTCTYSLCKGCIKEAEFVSVRGNKGFCQTCMSTVLLIETNQRGNEKMDGVDFDDKSSWEYLFKDYWLDLKAKLSLTLEELTQAKSPFKISNVVGHDDESSDDNDNAKEEHTDNSKEEQGTSSHKPSKRRDLSISLSRKGKKRSRNTVIEEPSVQQVMNGQTSTSEDVNWASDELMELVAHMKNGDRSVLSQFEVQALLLEYIKRNNLRDPRRKSQIICDSRLENLFGKSRVGHFEMLKLLESHFVLKEVLPLEAEDNQGGVVDPDPSQMDAEGISDMSTKATFDKRRKTRKKVEKEAQTNLDDYAAIDVHNISFMYLRRNLMEELIDDMDTFNEKVTGSFVRIRISGAGQRQDVYRLVQVVGTGKAAEKYKSGKKMTDILLEILNLNKTEVITIDIISNQDFTEEECKRLRQSIKCGLIGRLTVGEVLEKARALQTVRVNDWLESEKLRLGHLRDRASEKGHRKELRECVEKLQLLGTPEERRRRLNEVPEIHADPNMDPDYESVEEEEEQDVKFQAYSSRLRASYIRNGRDVKSPGKGGSISSDNWSSQRNSNIWSSNRGSLTEGAYVAESVASEGEKASELNQGYNLHHMVATGQETNQWNNENQHHVVRPREPSDVPSGNPAASISAVVEVVSKSNESEKIWHYKDPSGKIQGPFSMTQLRKWNTTGYFPPNLKIWRISEKQEDVILLSDALVGNLQNDLPEWEPQLNNTAQPLNVSSTARCTGSNVEDNCNHDSTDSNQKRENWQGGHSDYQASQLSSWTSTRDSLAVKEANALPLQPQGQNTPRLAAPSDCNPHQASSYQARGIQGRNAVSWNGDQDQGSAWTKNKPMELQHSNQPHDNPSPNHSSSSHQSSIDTWRVQPANDSSNLWRNVPTNLHVAISQPSIQGWYASQGALDKLSPSNASVQVMASEGNTSPAVLSIQNDMSQPNKSLPLSGSTTSQFGTGLDKNQCMEINMNIKPKQVHTEVLSANYSETTSSKCNKSQDHPHVWLNDHDLGKKLLEANDRSYDVSRKELDVQASVYSVAHSAMGTTGSPSHLQGSISQSNTCISADYLKEKDHIKVKNSGPASSSLSPLDDLEKNRAPLAVSMDKQTYDALGTTRAGSHLVLKETPSGASQLSHHPSATAANMLVSSDGSIDRLMQSSASVFSTQGNSGTDSVTNNNLIPQLLPCDGSKQVVSSQFGANASLAPVQPSQTCILDGSNVQNEGTGFPVASPNPSMVVGAAQGNGNMNWAPSLPGNMNMGWGLVPQGNVNMAWPAQAIANWNVGLGAPAQINTLMNSSWVTPTQGNANMNVTWVSPVQPVQGTTNQTSGWRAQALGNITINPGWGMVFQGDSNPNPSWTPTLTNPTQNWGTPMQGNINTNAGRESGQGNGKPTWDASAGNSQSWSSQQPQSGDRHSGQSDNMQANNSGHGARRSSWNKMLHGGSGPPPRGQVGVCKFHENGHCKKGASCNYIHS